jgi:hypothetical protein
MKTVHWKIIGIVATLVMICSIPLYLWRIDRQHAVVREMASPTPAAFAGSQKCAQCHNLQYDLWRRSHHDLAMDKADQTTVLGDFNDAVFEYFGAQSKFFRKGDQFWVRTQGPGGATADFQIQYVFGVYPLQQYLIPFPGGRLQCLPMAWDATHFRHLF